MRLHDCLDFRAREHADTDFAQQGERRLSYGEARARVDRIANALIEEGLEVGDRIAFLSKNSIDHALIYYACSKAGVVPVPLNFRLAAPEWEYIINDAGAKLLVAQPEFAAAIAPVRDGLSTVKRALVVDGEAAGWESYEDFVASGADGAPQRVISADGDLYQMYTSGTTGRPKGAVLTQRAVTSQLYQGAMAFGGQPGDRSLIVAPLYHAAASLMCLATVQMGGTLIIQEDFVPAEVVRALSEEQVRLALLVPAMIQFCLVAVPDIGKRRFDDLELIVYGASPIAEQTLRQAMEIFRCDFMQGYGMTETTAAATYLFPQDHRAALDGRPELLSSAGRPLVGTEVRIVDDEGQSLPNGEIGEVAIRGPQLMSGYWNLPEASAKALRDGWIFTGDAGILDDEGYLYIQDRVKDMIVSGGENVYPREIEDVLFEHPAVADAAVIGVPSDKWGESVMAILVRKDGEEAGADEILEFCRGKLGGYKQPRAVEFVDALPRNPSGKVLKKELREPYWKGHDRRVG